MGVQEIEVRKDGIIYCVYVSKDVLPSAETMKNMKAAGYKFYQGGKLYKPEKN